MPEEPSNAVLAERLESYRAETARAVGALETHEEKCDKRVDRIYGELRQLRNDNARQDRLMYIGLGIVVTLEVVITSLVVLFGPILASNT